MTYPAWRIVPVEASDEMLSPNPEPFAEYYEDWRKVKYAAMLSARPAWCVEREEAMRRVLELAEICTENLREEVRAAGTIIGGKAVHLLAEYEQQLILAVAALRALESKEQNSAV